MLNLENTALDIGCSGIGIVSGQNRSPVTAGGDIAGAVDHPVHLNRTAAGRSKIQVISIRRNGPAHG